MIISIRHTQIEDLPEVMHIYQFARNFMIENNNPNQWDDVYPEISLIEKDINNKHSYVCINDDGEIVGVFYFNQEEDPAYLNVYEGEWLNDSEYGVIHRIASSGHERGVMSFVINWCLHQINNIRIDTNRDNMVMRNALQKLEFQYCGIIYLENGEERLAYQRFHIQN